VRNVTSCFWTLLRNTIWSWSFCCMPWPPLSRSLAFSRAHELYIIQHDTMCQKNSLRGLRTRFFFAKGGRRAAQNSLEKHDEKWVKNLTPRAPAPGQNGPPDRAPAAARVARSRKAVCYRRSARVLKRKVTRPPQPHRHAPVRCRHTRARGPLEKSRQNRSRSL